MTIDLDGLVFIKFAKHPVRDADFTWIDLPVKKGESVAEIAKRREYPELARIIADKNGIVSTASKFSGKKKGRKSIKVPKASEEEAVVVLAGAEPPRVTDGYAKLSVLERPQRTGLSVFDGYNPIVMEVPIQFEAWTLGGVGRAARIEEGIKRLEEFAGRGRFSGAGTNPPAVVRVSAVRNGQPVPLLPRNYGFTDDLSPLWQVSGIQWDANPLRHDSGNRLRQAAVVTVQQYVALEGLDRVSVKARAKGKKGQLRGEFVGGMVGHAR